MFCANCGMRSTPGVNFCKQCGANLSTASPLSENTSKPPKVTGMFWAVALFGVASLSVLFGAIIALTALGAEEEALVPTAIFGTAGIVTIAWLLIRQLSRYINLSQNYTEPSRPQQISQSHDRAYPQLEAPPRPVSSVTEHTTRNFAPVRDDDRAQR